MKSKIKISLLTGGHDKPYVFGLVSGLIPHGITIDFIGNDEMQNADIVKVKEVNYFNLRGDQSEDAKIGEKTRRVLKYYFRLLKYAAKTDSKLFHIQWLNKFIYFDRTFLNMYYKILGKKLLFTAHNINAGERDSNDSFMNRFTLMFMYHIVDHIFVHTDKMKMQLTTAFHINENKVTVIRFGVNNTIPNRGMRAKEAKQQLSLRHNDRVILFFGIITPYKGLEYLLMALAKLKKIQNCAFKLIIAGKIDRDASKYWESIERIISERDLEDFIIKRIEFIPDEEIEIYFKAADLLVLPYKHIYQSGILFLAYNFGLPVIATDVGSLREDIVEGETGYICQPEDPEDLARKIELYFTGDLFKNLETSRDRIIKYANEKYSWEGIGEKTYAIYKSLQ